MLDADGMHRSCYRSGVCTNREVYLLGVSVRRGSDPVLCRLVCWGPFCPIPRRWMPRRGEVYS
ncbi:unnamed protein product [Nippostrongylus brasiliensis]|uniref:Transposase n=1 Tax=Nippostrongylus brasiliensis TaxID=27835 RepID=A0A0N4Y5Y6_NIPBR|nr:unnamed protein product [Nippostrongylus brasiliensis]